MTQVDALEVKDMRPDLQEKVDEVISMMRSGVGRHHDTEVVHVRPLLGGVSVDDPARPPRHPRIVTDAQVETADLVRVIAPHLTGGGGVGGGGGGGGVGVVVERVVTSAYWNAQCQHKLAADCHLERGDW